MCRLFGEIPPPPQFCAWYPPHPDWCPNQMKNSLNVTWIYVLHALFWGTKWKSRCGRENNVYFYRSPRKNRVDFERDLTRHLDISISRTIHNQMKWQIQPLIKSKNNFGSWGQIITLGTKSRKLRGIRSTSLYSASWSIINKSEQYVKRE
jgi:hypothetical protein